MDKLEISTVKRDTVNIDGTDYELKRAEEFSVKYCSRLASIGKEIQEMDMSKKSNVKKLSTYMNRIVSDILVAPPKILKKLTDNHKIEIINFFLEQRRKRSQAIQNSNI